MFDLIDVVKADVFKGKSAPDDNRLRIQVMLPVTFFVLASAFDDVEPELAERIRQFIIHIPFVCAELYIFDHEAAGDQRIKIL